MSQFYKAQPYFCLVHFSYPSFANWFVPEAKAYFANLNTMTKCSLNQINSDWKEAAYKGWMRWEQERKLKATQAQASF